MPIGVGINSGVFLESVTMDDKFAVEFKFAEADAPRETSGFAALQADEVIESTASSIRLFAPNEEKDLTLTEDKKLARIEANINKTKGILQHIMKGYMTFEEMPKLGKVAFNGLDITATNYAQVIQGLEAQRLIHKNMVQEFINAMRPYLNNPELKFRLLLLRQSKEKHFATFRGKFVENQPFYESMDIPETASKVKFSDYEISNKLNDPTPMAKPESTGVAADAAPLTAESVFGG
jgi:hypothetical protein